MKTIQVVNRNNPVFRVFQMFQKNEIRPKADRVFFRSSPSDHKSLSSSQSSSTAPPLVSRSARAFMCFRTASVLTNPPA